MELVQRLETPRSRPDCVSAASFLHGVVATTVKEWAGYVPGVLPHSRFGQFRAVWHGIPDSIGRWLFVQQEYGLNLILMHLR